jgi:uncharacterized integral membrane protein
MNYKTIIVIILVIFITAISMQNTHTVDFKVLVWDFSISLIFFLYVILFIGIFIGYSLPRIVKISRKRSKKKADSEELPARKTS